MGNASKKAKPSYQFKKNARRYHTLADVQQGLRDVGLESSNLILGIDYTKSNNWTGKVSYAGKCLHLLEPNVMNPYQQVIDIVGRTLAPFDDDDLIPVYGFGDATTTDKAIFPFNQGAVPCNGFTHVLQRYNEITPSVKLSGPTCFAPLIYEAIRICKEERSYHILVIIADGQVSNAKLTAEAIIAASAYPLSIIIVGVGDGPWEVMEHFDDELPNRKFDNLHFVPFAKTMYQAENPDVTFSIEALQEIPDQYASIQKLGLLQ